MGQLRFTAADARVARATAVYILLLTLFPLMLSEPVFRYTFSEEGPYEQLSIAGWVLAALLILVRIRPLGLKAWTFASIFVMFAAREADLHKAFTVGSIFKSRYYLDAAAPIRDKLVSGIVAAGMIALVVYAGFVIMRFLFRQGGLQSRTGFWLMLGTASFVLCKVVDRAPAILAEGYGITLPPLAMRYASAFEEGMELLNPLLFMWSIWISQTEKSPLFLPGAAKGDIENAGEVA
ncbi:MAG: hypothetical protein V4632_13215 [Pseudomonadota bacterium]